ncbi:tetratricopeptide repeat protein [Vampirovibrio chlorellavorus]|uniref:tetratricopeptide repeat protein n=1 Tax=Vampirovibrio chlorellavorus TaxID=758823 RepID=UPI0026EF64F2|nr:tetratricopeptide repeat protein [Vampirovibrio chlorellavorus]
MHPSFRQLIIRHPGFSHLRFRPVLAGLLWAGLFTFTVGQTPGWVAEPLEALVNQGNIAAGKQDYPSAMAAYEKALPLAPTDKTLRNNLAVIYANHAVGLQEKQQFEAAFQYLNKAQALITPGSSAAQSIQASRASVYFAQAMALKESTTQPTAADYQKMRALLEQAITLSPQEVAFQKAMAGLYLDEAYQLAIQERYAEAIPLLEKALTHDPANKAVKQSLANVYLGQGKNDLPNRKSWVDKALAVDNSPQIQQVANRLLAAGQNTASSGKPVGFASSPNEAKSKAPASIAKLSVNEMIRDMEGQLQITPPDKATLNQRLETLEQQVLGQNQTGPLAVRTKTVYTALMGSSDALQSGTAVDPNLIQAPASDPENSYLDEIFKVTDGKVVRWGRFPLRVYFEEPAKDSTASTLYKAEYKAAALKGFEIWKERTDGYVQFLEIKNPQAADIIVNWTEAYTDRFADPEKVPDVYKHYSPPKRSPLLTVVQMASAFTPGYFSLVPQAAAAGLQYQQYRKLAILQDESKIALGLSPTKTLNPEAAQLLIQNMAAKEFGHALGLKGSSSRAGDLLYPELRSDVAQTPTVRDLTTLRELYNRPPNIILNIR